MKKNSSTNQQIQQRRNFIATALVGGTASLWATQSAWGAAVANAPDECGALTAADPLYFYMSLAKDLQPAAIEETRKFEATVQASQSEKLRDLWALSDKLKAELPKKSSAHAAVDRVNSLAYIGQTNAQSNPGYGARSRVRAHAKSQNLIVEEILKAGATLPAGDVRISAKAWALLQELLAKIKELREFQPSVERARADFNQTIQTITVTIKGIQTALLDASSAVVKGDKEAAKTKVRGAIDLVQTLPGWVDPSAKPDPKKPKSQKQMNEADADQMTPNKFISMLDPGVFQLIENPPAATTSDIKSKRRSGDARIVSAAYVSTPVAPFDPPDPQTVRAIVRECFVSGAWWQVVAVAAVCLPLWSYPRGEQRKGLIYSALTSIPRGPKSKLWEAAYYLDQLRP